MDQDWQQASGGRRRPLSRGVVLQAAVELADESGIDAVSMRNLAARLDVVPMALYNHVANKEELLDGMIDMVVEEIEPSAAGGPWRDAVSDRILSSRRVMLRHTWTRQLLESRTIQTPAVLAHMDAIAGTFRTAGFSVELTHQAMHALGRRMWGLNHDLFPAGDDHDGTSTGELSASDLAATSPHLAELAEAYDSGRACDPQVEFEFALDLLLDGFERLHRGLGSLATSEERQMLGRAHRRLDNAALTLEP